MLRKIIIVTFVFLIPILGCKFNLGNEGHSQTPSTPAVQTAESTPKNLDIDVTPSETAKPNNESDNDSIFMKGTENTEFSDDDCFIYKDFVVKLKESEDGGSIVSAYSRGSGTNQQLCKSPGKAILTVPDDDNNSFYGLYRSYLFIDQGTSASSRTLPVFDLETGKLITKLDYYDDIVLNEGRYLEFNTWTNLKGNPKTCKNYAEWKRNGDVVWVQGMKYDLQTKTSVKIGGLKCAYAE